MGSLLLVVGLVLFSSFYANAQTMAGKKYVIGGRFGLSLLDGNSGLQLGATGTYALNRDMGISGDFNLNTQSGTPVELNGSLVYNLQAPGQKFRPYLDGGMSLWFYTGGPYLGLRVGGGLSFDIAPNLSIPADLQMGPVFVSGTTVFYVAITSGIRYALP